MKIISLKALLRLIEMNVWLNLATIPDTNSVVGGLTSTLQGNWQFLAIAIVLILIAVFVLGMLKNILVNSALGLAVWGILVFVFKVPLAFLPSLIGAALLGPAGVGIVLILHFLGINL